MLEVDRAAAREAGGPRPGERGLRGGFERGPEPGGSTPPSALLKTPQDPRNRGILGDLEVKLFFLLFASPHPNRSKFTKFEILAIAFQ